MKKLFLLALFACAPASAVEIRSTIVDSVQLSVDGPALQTTRMGSSYSVSGSGVDVSTLGGLSGGSATAPATITTTSASISEDGAAFTFSETANVGDVAVTSQSELTTNGRVATPNLYGDSIQTQGGSAGTLAGTLSPTGVATVTAGGPGTTALGQRTIELSVFN